MIKLNVAKSELSYANLAIYQRLATYVSLCLGFLLILLQQKWSKLYRRSRKIIIIGNDQSESVSCSQFTVQEIVFTYFKKQICDYGVLPSHNQASILNGIKRSYLILENLTKTFCSGFLVRVYLSLTFIVRSYYNN